MHPFYGPSARMLEGRASTSGGRERTSGGRASTLGGLVSMAAYLAFWAGAIGLAKRELDARFPRAGRPATSDDRALAVLRERYARGEIDDERYLAMRRILAAGPGDAGPGDAGPGDAGPDDPEQHGPEEAGS